MPSASDAPTAHAPGAPRSLLRRFGLRRTVEVRPAAPFDHPASVEHADATPVDPAAAALIDEIRSHNPSASQAFLATFTKRDLETYLEHLASAKEPRGRASRWLRPGDTPAMVLRQQRD